MSPARLRTRSDDALVARVRQGDARAFAILHQRHRGALVRYAERLLQSSSLAEDVVQDSFIKVHRLLLEGSPGRALSLRPFLFRVVRNGALDVLRAQHPTAHAGELERCAAGERTDPAQRLLVGEDLRAMLRDIARLPQRQREVLLRREVDGATTDELAAELGITPVAAKSLVARARRTLVAGGAAREAACDDVRAQLQHAHGLRRRATGDVHRHLRECPECRAYRERLRTLRRAASALSPTPVLLAFAGSAGGGTGLALKGGAVAALGGAVVAGGALVFPAGAAQPFEIPSAGVLSERLRPGAVVPAGAAVVHRRVGASPERVRVIAMSCPDGTLVAGAIPQHGATTHWGLDPQTAIGADRHAAIRIGRSRQTVDVVLLCKRPGAGGSILAATAVARAAAARVRRICVRRAYLYESPGTGTIGSVYRRQPVVLRRLTKNRRWASVRTDAGVIGWVRASALCPPRG